MINRLIPVAAHIFKLEKLYKRFGRSCALSANVFTSAWRRAPAPRRFPLNKPPSDSSSKMKLDRHTGLPTLFGF